MAGMLVLHTGFAFIEPPQRYPDLFPALFAIYGFVNLGLAYIYFAVSLWM